MTNYILKTCPFCGGIAEIYKRPTGLSCKKEMKDIPSRITEYFKVESNHGSVYYSYYDFCFIVRCMDKRCVGRDTKAYYDEAEAVEAWNRRANHNGQIH